MDKRTLSNPPGRQSKPVRADRRSGASRRRGQQGETKTYCLQLEATTGTRIGHTECRTKKEWAALGIDVDELLAK